MSITQNAVTGANMGSMLFSGNPYAVVGGAIIGTLLGGSQRRAQEKQQQQQLEYLKQQNTLVLREQARHSMEVQRQNRHLLDQTRQAMEGTAQQRNILDGAAKAAMGSVELMGNSMQHVLTDYARQQSNADAQTLYNLEQETVNLNNSLFDIANRARASFQDPTIALNQMQSNQKPKMGFMDAFTQIQGLYTGRTASFGTDKGVVGGTGLTQPLGISGSGGGSINNLF